MWRPRPNKSAPGYIFLYLLLAVLFVVIAWRAGSDGYGFERIYWLNALLAVLLAGWEGLRYYLKKRAARNYDEAVQSGRVPEDKVRADERLRQKFLMVVCAVWSLYWCICVILDLLKDPPWVNNAAYHGLFALGGVVVGLYRWQQYRKDSNEQEDAPESGV